ncbi:hypothetical protein TWF281_003044 [Arthrobotrys megalospora]
MAQRVSSLPASVGEVATISDNKTSLPNPPVQPSQLQSDRPKSEQTGKLLEEKAIDPSFFYSVKGLYVKCATPQFIYEKEPWTSPDFPNIDRSEWIDWKAMTESREAAYAWINRRRYRCHTCKCDEKGKVILQTRNNKDSCSTQRFADVCSLTLGCICMADLIQPTVTSLDGTFAEYQSALDSIPLTAKLANKNYKWQWGDKTIGFSEESLQLANHLPLIPGSETADFDAPNKYYWTWPNLNPQGPRKGGLKRDIHDALTGSPDMNVA